MKKTVIFLCLALSVLSCSKEQPEAPAADEHITLDFSISDGFLPETKGIKKSWANNDRMYIIFDKTVSENPEYLKIKYVNSTKKWVPDTWTEGLESKIYHKTSGTLTALYMPNDKVGGSISFARKYDSSTYSYVYTVSATDRQGNVFKSYAVKAANKSYTVKNGVLSASFSMEPLSDSYFQFCIPNKDRAGNTITNEESHYYKMSTDYVVYASHVYRMSSEGEFSYQNTPKGYMTAYFSSGLCFSGVRQNIDGTESKYYFHLVDSKNNVKYLLRVTANLSTSRAWKLPALCDKDSEGNYRWEIEPEG